MNDRIPLSRAEMARRHLEARSSSSAEKALLEARDLVTYLEGLCRYPEIAMELYHDSYAQMDKISVHLGNVAACWDALHPQIETGEQENEIGRAAERLQAEIRRDRNG